MKNPETVCSELEFRNSNAKDAVARMKNAQNASELRRAWESFLNEFGVAIGVLITAALSHHEAKAWGYRLKNESNENDEGLMFVRQARNHLHHGITPFAHFSDPSVELGGMGSVGRNSSVHFSNNIVISAGRAINTGEFSVTTQDGKPNSFKGRPNTSIVEKPTAVRLLPVYNEEKRKTFPVPLSVGGKTVEVNDPTDLAVKSLDFLDDKIDELLRIIQ